jgi:hypothetical protein
MIVGNSRAAILVCAMLAVSTIALSTPGAPAGTAINVSAKYRVLPCGQGHRLNSRSMPGASQVHEHAQDPFASMLLE